MKIHCSYNKLIPPEDLNPHPRNPNSHSADQIALIGSVLRQNGWRAPVTVSKRSGLIIRGHGRVEAAILEGAKKVPVDIQTYASEAAELEDLLADNMAAELSSMGENELKAILEELAEDPAFDPNRSGLTKDQFDDLFDVKEMVKNLDPIPAMECQPFEHHDYLVFMFRDMRDWMQALQLIGVPRRVNNSIDQTTTPRVGIGRVLDGKRLLDLYRKASTHEEKAKPAKRAPRKTAKKRPLA